MGMGLRFELLFAHLERITDILAFALCMNNDEVDELQSSKIFVFKSL